MQEGKVMNIRIASVLTALLLTACALVSQKPQSAIAEAQPSTPVLAKDYRIGVDDLVQISVWDNPELSVTVPVRPDGKISVPIIGDVQVGGLTSQEAAASIRDKLAAYIRDPQVAVILTDLRSHQYLTRVRVTGAVAKPTSIPHRPGMTVLDLVLEAGGINQFAAPDNTKLYRKTGAGTKVFDIRLGEILKEGHLETNVELQPGDVVTIPERLF
jgi:polysaccharide export outer membrane protein